MIAPPHPDEVHLVGICVERLPPMLPVEADRPPIASRDTEVDVKHPLGVKESDSTIMEEVCRAGAAEFRHEVEEVCLTTWWILQGLKLQLPHRICAPAEMEEAARRGKLLPPKPLQVHSGTAIRVEPGGIAEAAPVAVSSKDNAGVRFRDRIDGSKAQ